MRADSETIIGKRILHQVDRLRRAWSLRPNRIACRTTQTLHLRPYDFKTVPRHCTNRLLLRPIGTAAHRTRRRPLDDNRTVFGLRAFWSAFALGHR